MQMNRETWFRILQVAVVAPFLYTMSEQQKNAYFKLGLKLVAGSIVIMNVEPLMRDLQPVIQTAMKMKADADAISAKEKANAIEGEFTSAAA
jgi:hypothetical protein